MQFGTLQVRSCVFTNLIVFDCMLNCSECTVAQELGSSNLKLSIGHGTSYNTFELFSIEAMGWAGRQCVFIDGETGSTTYEGLLNPQNCQDQTGGSSYKAHVVCKTSGQTCDGNWKRVVKQDSSRGENFATGNEFYTTKNQLNEFESNIFSINQQLPSMINPLGQYHFRMVYPDINEYVEWMQTSNPAADTTVTGFQPITSPDGSFSGTTSFCNVEIDQF